MWRQIHIPKVIVTNNGREKSEKINFAKGNNSIKSRSNTTKFKLDLYHVETNSYMKFQVNMSKDGKEKSRKRNFSKGQ